MPPALPLGLTHGAPDTARIRCGAAVSPGGISRNKPRPGCAEHHKTLRSQREPPLPLGGGDKIIFSVCFTTFSSELTGD